MILCRTFHPAIACIVGILAMACTTVSPESASSAVPASKAFLSNLRPADLGRDVEAAQLVTVSREGNAVLVEVRLSLKAGRLLLVAQDMLGQRVMTVTWTEAGIHDEHPPNLPPVVSPAGMLADFVAICWPEDAVRRALEPSGASLIVQGNQRIIMSGRGETMRATVGWPPQGPWNGRTNYRNVRAGYSVDIQSVEQP